MKKVIVSVINDLSTDQRVDRVCRTLVEMGFDVSLVGRKKRDSIPLVKKPHSHAPDAACSSKKARFFMQNSTSGFSFIFYFHKANLLVSNDLDTLLPNFLISRLKNFPLVYDSHENFTEVPELVNRKWVQNTWKAIEKFIFPRLKHVFTVNESLAAIFREKYGVDVKVVRNVPYFREYQVEKSRSELGLPEDKKIILMQGAGINIQRGAEEAITGHEIPRQCTFAHHRRWRCHREFEKNGGRSLYCRDKVRFIPRLPFDELYQFTVHADIGLTIDKDTNINYRFSLPNKLFDYIQARVPVLASPLPEISKIILRYDVGCLIENHDPQHIADKIREMLGDPVRIAKWKENLKFAAAELCWENEKQALITVYETYAG